jgi:Protein of unknown function (DUF1524)
LNFQKLNNFLSLINFDFDIIKNELTNEYGIERINTIIFGLETSTLIPYVLYILKNVTDKQAKNELFECLESYIMRRMVVHANTKSYNQLFSDSFISHQVLSKQEFTEFLEKKSDKINFFPINEELENGFHTEILVNKQSAGILYLIESKIRNEKLHSTKLLGINKYSLEHLMPKKWENNWGELSNQDDRNKRNRKLLTLGNLTIITQSLNATIRDSSWEIKKEGRAEKKCLLQYSGGLETICKYLRLSEWNERTIEERANDLYEQAKTVWKI